MNTHIQVMPAGIRLDRLMKDNKVQFWFLQIFGWCGYAFFVTAEAWVNNMANPDTLLYLAMATILGLILSMAMRQSYLLIWDYSPVKRFVLSLLTLGVATLLWSQWKLYISYSLSTKAAEHMFYESIYWFSYSFFILLSWTGLYYGIKYYKMVQKEHEKALKAEAMAHQAQLKMLRYQLNPHFLFNTLNSISTLVMDSRGTLANNMLSELSRFLRYSLDNDPMQRVTLEKELGAMQLYLDIEKIRFGERLQLEYDVDESVMSALIPSMLLQPLIENAIKYAVANSEQGGMIKIAAHTDDSMLSLEVSDNGPGIIQLNDGTACKNGIGLSNIRDRLTVLYEDNHTYEIRNREGGGLTINIRIPLQFHDKAGQWRN